MSLLTTFILLSCVSGVTLVRGDSSSSSDDSSDSSDHNGGGWISVCQRPNLFTSNCNSLSFATQIYTDGRAANLAGKSLTVARGSSVMAVRVVMNNGLARLSSWLVALQTRLIDRITCTNVAQKTTAWTAANFNDSNWPSLSLSSLTTSTYSSAVGGLSNRVPFSTFARQPLICRLYLVCRPQVTTTPVPVPTSTTKTTTTAVPTTTTATPVPTTTTTTTTTTPTTTTEAPATTSDNQGSGTTPVPPTAPKFSNVSSSVTAVGGYTTPSLSCSFVANPPPSQVEWRRVSNGNVISQSAVTLTETDPGWFTMTYTPDSIAEPWLDTNADTYQCYANNSFGVGQASVAVSVPVQTISFESQVIFQSVTLDNTFGLLFQLPNNCESLTLYFADASDATADCTTSCVTVDFIGQSITDTSSPVISQSFTPSDVCNRFSPNGLAYVWISIDVNNIFTIGQGSTVYQNAVASLQLASSKSITRIGTKVNDVPCVGYFFI